VVGGVAAAALPRAPRRLRTGAAARAKGSWKESRKIVRKAKLLPLVAKLSGGDWRFAPGEVPSPK
jgi:hypothetical protein